MPEATDDYKFYVSADDGVRLYIDDERVIDDWQRHGETLDTASKHLTSGQPFKMRLEYFENTGKATARFGVASATRPLGENTKKVVERADAVVLCMGFDPATEGEGSDRTFRLPGGQDSFIEQVAGLNKKVIVVLTAGGKCGHEWLDRQGAGPDSRLVPWGRGRHRAGADSIRRRQPFRKIARIY